MSSQSQAPNPAIQELFNALADPTRRSIIELLANNGQMSATNVYENFPVSHPAVSQHLKVLREANLVNLKKDAQRHIYGLNVDSMRHLERWANQTTKLWEERFERLDEVLEVEKRKLKTRR